MPVAWGKATGRESRGCAAATWKLLHLGSYSSTILPALLDLLKSQGFELATLEEVQRDPAYDGDPHAASRQGGSLVEQWMDVRNLPYPAVPPKPSRQLAELCNVAAGTAERGTG